MQEVSVRRAGVRSAVASGAATLAEAQNPSHNPRSFISHRPGEDVRACGPGRVC